jgi:beta-phosphoglucomutase family hydrolase
MPSNPTITVRQHDFDAAIFDLDGVLTDTARLHAASWKGVFDEFLRRRAEQERGPFTPFDEGADYLAYVDGRTRADGVRTFLAARRIHLPEGAQSDPPNVATVRAIGERKARLFLDKLRQGVKSTPGAEALLKRLRRVGIRTAVASASKNCAHILRAAGLDRLVDVRVDGIDAERLGFPGKPDPALFIEAARRLGVEPSRIILFEDALAGVEAGWRGGFACVVGIDRDHQREGLRQRGAGVVIEGLWQVEVDGAPLESAPERQGNNRSGA